MSLLAGNQYYRQQCKGAQPRTDHTDRDEDPKINKRHHFRKNQDQKSRGNSEEIDDNGFPGGADTFGCCGPGVCLVIALFVELRYDMNGIITRNRTGIKTISSIEYCDRMKSRDRIVAPPTTTKNSRNLNRIEELAF